MVWERALKKNIPATDGTSAEGYKMSIAGNETLDMRVSFPEWFILSLNTNTIFIFRWLDSTPYRC